jgi:hypothetical protein
MALSNTSRYLLTDVVEYRSVVTGELIRQRFVDLRQRVDTPAQDDKSLVYASGSSWAGIGVQQLLDPNAWWAIADLSGVIDPFTELTEGRKLRSPSVSRYQLQILPSDRGSF